MAGLASREDFSSVQLRKNDPTKIKRELVPHRPLMLIQVKGRRVCRARLVSPVAASVNSGDAFVLVAPGGEVFHWCGKYANVIERSR